MAQLAIKGYATRGKEVIKILKMLGGNNMKNWIGDDNLSMYFINEDGNIICSSINSSIMIVFSLEEFLEKYPFKVGDKVLYKHDNKTYFIRKMFWENDQILYELSDEIYSEECSMPDTLIFDVDVIKLQPYKEETMKERKYLELRMPLDDDDKLATEVTIGGNKMLPPNGYLIGKITQVDNGMLVEYVKQQPKYPKTYEECCLIMSGIDPARHLQYDTTPSYKFEEDLRDSLETLRKLIVCRDAYWKIAGDWKPDWTDSNFKYCLKKMGDSIEKSSEMTISCILAFPTKEMRDAFKENFDVDIDLGKEFL